MTDVNSSSEIKKERASMDEFEKSKRQLLDLLTANIELCPSGDAAGRAGERTNGVGIVNSVDEFTELFRPDEKEV